MPLPVRWHSGDGSELTRIIRLGRRDFSAVFQDLHIRTWFRLSCDDGDTITGAADFV
jgi:hypothetical protein